MPVTGQEFLALPQKFGRLGLATQILRHEIRQCFSHTYLENPAWPVTMPETAVSGFLWRLIPQVFLFVSDGLFGEANGGLWPWQVSRCLPSIPGLPFW